MQSYKKSIKKRIETINYFKFINRKVGYLTDFY